jgi:hypothetical protein
MFPIRCCACLELRDASDIDVRQLDETPPDLVPGTFLSNFQYCNDRPACKAVAEKWTGYLFPNRASDDDPGSA